MGSPTAGIADHLRPRNFTIMIPLEVILSELQSTEKYSHPKSNAYAVGASYTAGYRATACLSFMMV